MPGGDLSAPMGPALLAWLGAGVLFDRGA